MKLRNKKTGGIGLFENAVDIHDRVVVSTEEGFKYYTSLAKLSEEWEDYEEPKEYCYITNRGNFHFIEDIDDEGDKKRKEIGNYFETEEEAEEAAEKLKAWKRLKDKGFKFTDWNCPCRELEFTVDEDKFFKASGEVSEETRADLDLLFGGEE